MYPSSSDALVARCSIALPQRGCRQHADEHTTIYAWNMKQQQINYTGVYVDWNMYSHTNQVF